MKDIFRFKTFAMRLSVYSAIAIAVVFTIVTIVFYTSSRRTILNETMKYTHSVLKTMAVQIEDSLNNTEIAVTNKEWSIKNSIHDKAKLEAEMISFVKDNPGISNSSLAFEPYYFPGKKYCMLFAVREGNDVKLKYIGDNDYDYFCMDWYLIPKLLKRNYWSEPYFDEGGGNIIMSTYSHPMLDKDGKVFALFTADVSLEKFTNLVKKLQPFETSYSFMLSRHGYYLTHEKKEKIMNETVLSTAFKQDSKEYEEIGRAMIAGKTGSTHFDNDGKDAYAFYTSIPSIGWSICCVCPSDIILKELNKTSDIVIVLFILGLIVIFFTVNRVIKTLTKPLEVFARSAELIANGKFDTPLPPIRTHDEIGELHYALDNMRLSLQNYIEQLKTTTASKERIENELYIASEIQMGMLPKIFPPFPDRDDIDLHAVLHPAKEVGGDLYDFFINHNRLFFAIGDVSGKGVPASLFMAITSSLFRTLAVREKTPKDIVKAMNDTICDNNPSNMFVTLIIGILDIKTGHLELCNAGHNPPIILNHGKKAELIDLNKNLPVGLMEKFDYKDDVTTLLPDSKLLMYTDGITEAEDIDKNLFTVQKLIEVADSCAKSTVRKITDNILAAVAEHAKDAPQSDDLTVMMINYKPEISYSMKKEIVIKNEMSEISKIEKFVEEIGEELNLSPAIKININLALEEAIANVVMYAYPAPGLSDIHLYARMHENELTFLISDHGLPFNPTEVKEPDITKPVEERSVGGLGIMIIRKIMNDVSYQRIDGENRLTMKKKL